MIDGSYEVPGRPIALTPARRLIAAPSSDPSMDEALARVRRIEALDKAAHAAASSVRHQPSAA